jgi:hypothetical protein
MPIQPTYPGVYIQELPSNSHTVTGVSTSVTAFVGRALRGPTDAAITVNSFADVQRTFGGLWENSMLGYTMRDFFNNGGSQAITVRVFNPNSDTDNGIALSPAATATAPASLGLSLFAKQAGAAGNNISCSIENSSVSSGTFDLIVAVSGTTQETYNGLKLSNISSALNKSTLIVLQSVPTTIPSDTTAPVVFAGGADGTSQTAIFAAANPGSWGNQLTASVNYNVSPQVAEQYGLTTTDLFNLIITDNNTGAVEQFNNLSVLPSPGQVNNVLLNQSKLLRINTMPATVPVSSTYSFSGGNDGKMLTDANILGNQANKTGLYALENVSVFNLLCIPPYTASNDVDNTVLTDAAAYCVTRRAFYVIDAPSSWSDTDAAVSGVNQLISTVGNSNAGNAAVFFPRVQYPDPLNNNQINTFAPCGMIAGMMANIDNKRGVWKAPAGLETGLAGVTQLNVSLTDNDSGQLNPIAVNCLRTMSSSGTVIWGARTLQGNDNLGSDWKYVPVRRMALYIEQSAYFGTQWAVFEPNDEPLWRQITLSLNGFMNGLFRQGAFQGQTTTDAYFVKCDSETTTQDDINNGIVNVLIGFAPLKPAEFVIISIQQIAGQN